MTVAAGAQNISNHFRDAVTVHPVTGYSTSGGQPIFGASRTVRARVSPMQKRIPQDNGDYIQSSGYTVLLPADDPYTITDYISLPRYGLAPVTGSVEIVQDQWGNDLFKEVTIL